MSQPAGKHDAREQHLDELLADCLRQLDRGQPIDREAFLRAHGDMAEELEELLGMAELVDRMAGPPGDESPENESPENGSPEDPRDGSSEQERGSTEGPRAKTVSSLFPSLAQSADSGVAEAGSGGAPTRRTFGEYELLEPLGRGGMGVVYKARQIRLDRLVAVKMVLAGRFASEEEVNRFHKEARAAGKLTHPNIVTVHQVGEIDGYHFYSMDYIPGTTLAQLASDGPLPVERAARYVQQIAQAVHHAHTEGILHRDLKPANVLIDQQDQPHVADFGLAKNLHEEVGYTSSGAALGTPSYMAPEQAAGKRTEIGPHSDIYSLGAILYQLLTGQPPFQADTPLDTLLQVLHYELPRPRLLNPDVNGDLEAVCLKCLRKDPQQRYASAQALADELERVLRGEPTHAEGVSRLGRAVSWVADIPLVTILTGRRTMRQPSVWHTRVHWLTLVAAFLLAFTGWGLWGFRSDPPSDRRSDLPAAGPIASGSSPPSEAPNPKPPNALPERSRASPNASQPAPFPARIRIGTADPNGMYAAIARPWVPVLQAYVGIPASAIFTKGSQENLQRLRNGEFEAAILQASVFDREAVAIVAPLYYEPSMILLRIDCTDIRSIHDLAGKNVSLGEEGSGMLYSGVELIANFGLAAEDMGPARNLPFTALADDPTLDAALVTTGLHNPDLQKLLGTGDFKLIGIDDPKLTSQPMREAFVIEQHHFPHSAVIPESGIHTVSSLAYLAVHKNANDELVSALLESFYDQSGLMEKYDELLEPQEITQWLGWETLPWHPAAQRFFRSRAVALPVR